ncbi:polar amino acid transport system substrate-binding protein [Streptacidiphilus sp. MAP12-16]|uniref:ABC transporter substrate-binding protein n=1 Tax=Streptacidiphilus sp. MAP12-16 TaxID=3156300 RepID=UPI003518D198
MARSIAQRIIATGAAVAAGSLLLTACGSSSTSGSSSAPNASQSVNAVGADAALVALVPAALKSAGTANIATDASYAPMEFKDASGNIVGMDVELGTAIMKKLGLKANFANASFDSILGGIAAKKYDLSLSSFTATQKREQAVDMVTYFNAGEAVAVLAGNPDKIDQKNLCGVKIAVQSGTTEADEIKNTINPACTKAGKPVATASEFTLQTDATSALVAKRDQAMMADSPVVDYAVQQSGGTLQKIGQDYNTAPYGIVLPKGDGQLAQAVQGAIKDLIKDGTYNQILTKWGVQSGALPDTQVVVNGATS